MLAEPLSPAPRTLFRADDRPVEWAVSKGHVDYAAAEAFMEAWHSIVTHPPSSFHRSHGT